MGRRALADRDPVRLDLEEGDWILVKPALSHGEQLEFLADVRGPTWAPGTRYDPLRYNDAVVRAYLVDWSFVGHDGGPLLVSPDAIRGLEEDNFQEVLRAIETHVAAVDARLADQKKTRAGATNSEPISQSVS